MWCACIINSILTIIICIFSAEISIFKIRRRWKRRRNNKKIVLMCAHMFDGRFRLAFICEHFFIFFLTLFTDVLALAWASVCVFYFNLLIEVNFRSFKSTARNNSWCFVIMTISIQYMHRLCCEFRCNCE